MYRHKKCRYVCGFVPLLDLNTAKVVHFIETTKQIPKYFIHVVKHKFYPPLFAYINKQSYICGKLLIIKNVFKMKKLLFLLIACISMSSCCTLFTRSTQSITFVGPKDTRIYDNGQKIATIGETGEASVRMRKKLSSKELVAKKDGYKPYPMRLDATFNPIACINLLNVIAWGIDLGTQKACKWDNTYLEIELEKSDK